jgi:glycine/serine hydroxymethyltransferase
MATEKGYRIISTSCDNHTMYVSLEKKGFITT